MNTRIAVLIVCAAGAWAGTPEMPRYRWENFTTENGLPDNHVFQVKVDGNRVWAATENGLALYQNGRWKVYGTADGLAHRAVLFIDVDPRTGDVWAATMGGPSRRAFHRRGPTHRRCLGRHHGRVKPVLGR